ncbi:MAG: P-loop NTPase fold protein [Chloroflexi bacterium]|nr:P-loop NTPase fold protein [Chloroflexota bacterium]
MTDEMVQTEQEQPLPWMKTSEAEIDPDNIWEHDALSREGMARNLTNILADPRGLSTMSIHGGWGTGKTFFLTRLRWQLKEEGFEAIYFNAWEDDFLHDPLLAILGQLTQELKGNRYSRLTKSALNAGSKLVRQLPIVAAKQVTSFDLGEALKSRESLADTYRDLIKTKIELRRKLNTLAARVTDAQEGRPLVFIIDELDRCRPTFAIELMERVKHIFDVPSLLFMFGINRDEMEKSLQSVYGNIDTDTYLRRFFDLELNIPPPDIKVFTERLLTEYGLPQYFGNFFTLGQRLPNEQFGVIEYFLPLLLDRLRIELRDAQYCVRLLAVLARSQEPNELLMPVVVAGLAALRIADRRLYLDYVRGEVRTPEVIDWLDQHGTQQSFIGEDLRQWNYALSVIEGTFYRSDLARRAVPDLEARLLDELKALCEGQDVKELTLVSRRLARLGRSEAEVVLQMTTYRPFQSEGDAVRRVASMLDLSAQLTKE